MREKSIDELVNSITQTLVDLFRKESRIWN